MAPEETDTIGDEETNPTAVGQRQAATAKLVPPGTMLGLYRVGTLLGQGGFGAVYRVRDMRNGQRMAMKILHHHDVDGPAAKRFAREVDVVRRIGHPNVVEIHDDGVLENGQLYYTMELLRGQNLRQYVNERNGLSPDECCDILAPLCDALEAAHGHDVVHRDLKMSNVFLSGKPEARRVVLLDFGVAKLLDDDGGSLTRSRELVGTPRQMAPEQLLCQPIDARADVYALGALLFGMLTGVSPFHNASPDRVREFHLTAQRPRPSDHRGVPPALDRVVERAMAIDKESRYPGALAFVEALRAAVASTWPAAADPPAAGPEDQRHAVGLYVGVHVEPDAMSDDAALDSMYALIDAVTELLSETELMPAIETSSEFLFIQPLDSLADRAGRDAVLTRARTLWQHLTARPDRDSRVRVHICLHIGPIVLRGEQIGGGDLLDFTRWVTDDSDGISVTEAFSRPD